MKTLQILPHTVKNLLQVVLISTFLSTMVYNVNSQTPDQDLQRADQVYNHSTHSDLDCEYPPSWNTPVNTGGSVNPCLMVINDISIITINGVSVSECDYIGAFYTDENGEEKCAGADYIQEGGLIFSIFGDIAATPEKEGFAFGEKIRFKVFSWSCAGGQTIKMSNVEIDEGYLNWYPLAFTVISQAEGFTLYECQVSNSEPGDDHMQGTSTDNWLRFTCPADLLPAQDLYDQTGGILQIIKEKYSNRVFWPEKGIYTLDEMEAGKVYLMKLF